MKKLAALFAVVGAIYSGGAVYNLYVLKPGNTVADAFDAGLLQVSVPARLSCNLWVHPDCRVLPDGGRLPQHVKAHLRARRISLDGGLDGSFIVTDIPDRADGGYCARLLGQPSDACDVEETSTCSIPSICQSPWPTVQVQNCACRNPAGGNCWTSNQADGGNPFLAPTGVTLSPGKWQGPGCVRKFCGPISLGDSEDWPAECPR